MSIYEDAIIKWGKDAQIRQAVEELSELITALCHSNRARHGYPSDKSEPVKENITEEIADVELMLEQVELIFGITRMDILAVRVKKIARLREWLKL